MDKLKQMRLGSEGLVVPAIGLGCMGMTPVFGLNEIYGKADEKEAIAIIHRSFELGGNFLDTADAYGPFLNEQLIAKAIGNNRSQYIIATKFGIEVNEAGAYTGGVNGKKDYVRISVERSLKNLNTDYIDLYYLHRLDKSTPVEETVASMTALVKEGKVKYIGLSEVSAATIRKAHAVHPLTAVQTEYSLFERSLEEQGIYDTLKELGIGLVANSPLGRGFLSGQLRALTGQSTQQHIQNKIIERAKVMLSTTSLSVSEIAYALGFDYPQSFHRLFKQITSTSPLKYRNSFN